MARLELLFLISICVRYTRQGTPTPVLPDFTNLKSQWATVSPSRVALSAYTPGPVTPRPCPSSTAGGWAVDPNLPLPTLGQVTTQLAGDVTSATNPTAANPTAANGTDTKTTPTPAPSQGESSSMTSTTARGGAVRSNTNILVLDDPSLAGCVLAIMTVGVAAFLLL